MPEIKHNFTKGKMNKDLDERLVPNGEYRDATNIQVSTSDGSDVGTIQNILGNTPGCIYNGYNPIQPGSSTVGSVSDEKNDSLYWLVAGQNDINSITNLSLGATETLKDMIMRTNAQTPSGCEPVFVDKYGWCIGIDDPSTETNSIIFDDANLYDNITPGMDVFGYSNNNVTFGPTLVSGVGNINVIYPLNYFQGESFQSVFATPFDVTSLDLYIRTFEDPNNPGVFDQITFPDGYTGSQDNLPPVGASQLTILASDLVQYTSIQNLATMPSVMSDIFDTNGTNLLNGAQATTIHDMTTGTICNEFNGCHLHYIFTIGVDPATGGTYPGDVNIPNNNYTTSGPAYGTINNPWGLPLLIGSFTHEGLNYKGCKATIEPAPILQSSGPNEVIHILPSSNQWLNEIYYILFDDQGNANVDQDGNDIQLQIDNSIGGGMNWPANSCINPSSVTSPNDNEFLIQDCDTGNTQNALNMNPDGRPLSLFVPSGDGAESVILNDSINLSNSDTICFMSERVLEFDSNRLITGINIIDDMLFWTDNFTEPKKINVSRSVAGTDPAGDTHTAVVNNKTGLNISQYNPIRKEHITVIRKSPKNALSLHLATPRDPGLIYSGITYTAIDPELNNNINVSSIISSSNNAVVYDFSALKVGDRVQFEIETDINNQEDFTLQWKNGDTLLLKEFNVDDNGVQTSPPLPLANHTIKGRITDWQWNSFVNDTSYNVGGNTYQPGFFGNQWNGGQTPSSAHGTAHVEIEILNLEGVPAQPSVSQIQLNYVVDRDDSADVIFENKFPRFSYRYKYEDGEYSTFAPWSEVAFLPSHFNYDSKKGWNTGMINHLTSVTLKGFVPTVLGQPIGQDIIEVDILYKEEGSPNIYVVETISPLEIPPPGALKTFNRWYTNEIEITSESIKNILPSNQLLRSWDNVPKKALAQDVSGNRIVYANYEQNFDLMISGAKYRPQFKNYLSSWSSNSAIGSFRKSIKSLRDYKLGVVFTDEYGRETPILISESGGFKVEKINSDKANRLVASLDGDYPTNMAYFKFFVKETSTEYYNLAMDRWYDAEDGNIWLAFPSTDRNKVDLETSLYFKKGNDEAIENTTKYKILAIESEAPEFIKTRRVQIGRVRHIEASGLFLFGTNGVQGDDSDLVDAPSVGETSFKLNYTDDFSGSSLANLEDITEDLYIQFATGSDYSQQYKVAQITSDKLNQGQFNPPTEYWVSLDTNLKDDINFIFDNAAAPNKATDDVVVYITKALVENSPKFDGRFFAKVQNDGKIKPQLSDSEGTNYIEKASKMIYALDSDGDLLTRCAQASLINSWRKVGNPDFTPGSNMVTFDFADKVYPGYGGVNDNNPGGINYNHFFAREAYFREGYDENHDGPYEPIGGDGVWFIDRSTHKYSSYAGANGEITNLIWGNNNNMNNFTPQDNNLGDDGWTAVSNLGPGTNHFSQASSMRLGFGGIGFENPDGSLREFTRDGSVVPNQYHGTFEDFFSVGEPGVGVNSDGGTVNFVERLEAGAMFKWEHDPTETVYTFINQTQKKNRVRFARHDSTVQRSGNKFHSRHLIWGASTYHRSFNINLKPSMAGWDPTAVVSNNFGFIENGLQLQGIKCIAENIYGSSNNNNDKTTNTITVDTIRSTCSNGNSPNGEEYTLHKGMMLSSYNNLGASPDSGNIIIKSISEYNGTGYVITLTGYHTPLHYDSDDISTNITSDGTANSALEFRQVVMNSVSNFTESNTDKYSAHWTDINGGTNNGGSGGIGAVGYKMIMVEPVETYPDGGYLPPDPFVWETEPKDNTGLDIYYEISENNPIALNPSTINSAIPTGSNIESPSGEGHGDWTNVTIVSNTSPTGDIITLSDFIWIGPGSLTAPDGSTLQPIHVGSLLRITKPNGIAFSVRIKEIYPDDNVPQASKKIKLHSSLYNSDYFLNWHNCFSFGNGVESNRIKDTFNLPYIANGIKASTTLEHEYKQERRKYGLIYSGIYNSTSGVNDLNQFIAAEKITKDINPIYGSIQRIKAGWGQGGDLVALCEDRILRILANKDALFNADGNSNVTATNRVLGTATPYAGEYGISTNPESFASESYRAYFADKVRGAIIRLSNDGLTAISDHGMKDWFRDNLKLTNKLVGSYDDKKDQYNITLNDINKTVTFKENVRGWVSFKSFIPENAISCANEYYTFKDGQLWRHHDENSPRNTFYNIHSSLDWSTFNVVLNDNPGIVKSFKTINYEGSKSKVISNLSDNQYYNLAAKNGWYIDSIVTNKQTGNIVEFIEKEGKWFNYIKGNPIQHVNNTNVFVNADGSSSFDQSSSNIQGLGVLLSVAEQSDVIGCMDSSMFNYDSNAVIDSGLCEPFAYGCMLPSAFNYDSLANTNDGSCQWQGCTDVNADNTTIFPNEAWQYGAGGCSACYDNNTCAYSIVSGCTDPTMWNYNSSANDDDGSCEAFVYGCMLQSADNYNALANTDDGTCIWYGCLEPLAANYFNATFVGIQPPESVNYSPFDGNYGLQQDPNFACTGDGCIDSNADNYDSNATYDPIPNNGSCFYCDYTVGGNNYSGTPITVTTSPENYIGEGGVLFINVDPDAPYMPYTYEVRNASGQIMYSQTFLDGNQPPPPYDSVSYMDDGQGNITFSSIPPETYEVTVVGNPPANICDYIDGNNVVAASNQVQFGCTDSNANNYISNADNDDGSCTYTVSCYECQSGIVNVETFTDADQPAVCGPPGSQGGYTFQEVVILLWQDSPSWLHGDPCSPGCMDNTTANPNGANGATNFDSNATWDPLNYDENNSWLPDYSTDANGVVINPGSCTYEGCTDPTADNYWPAATFDDGTCLIGAGGGGGGGFSVAGCTDSTAANYDSSADTDDGSCCYGTLGCMDPTADNYDINASCDDGSCAYGVDGCTDPTATNYNSNAGNEDGSCSYVTLFVTHAIACGKYGKTNGQGAAMWTLLDNLGVADMASPNFTSGLTADGLSRRRNGVVTPLNTLVFYPPTNPNGPMLGFAAGQVCNDWEGGDEIFIDTP